MEGYIDIHNHSLPGMDDGAADWKEAVSMVSRAAQDGVLAIIVTPHYKQRKYTKTKERIKTTQIMLQQYASSVNKNSEFSGRPDKTEVTAAGIRIYQGNEIWYTEECLTLLEEGKLSTMAGSRYVLIELSETADYAGIRRAIGRMAAYGYFPVLAHAERYRRLKKPEEIEELIDMGAYIQVNAQSVTGEWGRAPKSIANKLLRHRLVHFIASDAHNNTTRPPGLSACAAYVEKKYGKEYARELFLTNAMKMLEDEII